MVYDLKALLPGGTGSGRKWLLFQDYIYILKYVSDCQFAITHPVYINT